MAAPLTQSKPSKIADVIELRDDQSQVDDLDLDTGTGNYTLTVEGEETANIAHTDNAAAVQAALEALATVDPGDVVVSGTLPTLTLTWGGDLAAQPVDVEADFTSLTGGTPTLTHSTEGVDQFSPQGQWEDLGATREGIAITVNNAEDSYEVDQVAGEIGSTPTNWESSVATNFAEMTLEKFQLVWEGTAITTDAGPTIPEREMSFAGARSYTQRRLAVLFRRDNGAILMFAFHKVARTPQESTINFQKGGDPITLAMTFKALADATESDEKAQFCRVREQVIA
jgi:hypothetical protein